MAEIERKRLTKKVIESIKAPTSGRLMVYDEAVKGLAIRVTPTGATSWIVVRKLDGKPKKVTLGRYPDMTIEQARKAALAPLSMIANGIDPNREKKLRRGELTLSELWNLYLEFHARPKKAEKSVKEDEGTWRRYLSKWGSRRITSIESRDVQALHLKIGKANGKYAANRMIALLRKMFNVATTHGEFKLANPCRGVEMFREESRDRYLAGDELPRFFTALDAQPNKIAADAIRLLLLTGARKSNVLAMRWRDVDLVSAVWRIPATKNGEPLNVHLHAEAVTILKGLRSKTGDHEYVFPASRSGTKQPYLEGVRPTWEATLEAAGLDGLRLHDLRRTLGSWQAATGASMLTIGKSLGQKSQQATAVYARLDLEPVRRSVDTAVAAMMATKKPAAEQEGGDHAE